MDITRAVAVILAICVVGILAGYLVQSARLCQRGIPTQHVCTGGR